MRATLAGEIREEEQALAAGGCFLRLLHKQFVRIDLSFLRGGQLFAGHVVAEPLEAAARRKHAAEHAPLAFHRMAHRVHATAGVIGRFIRVGKHDTACAKRGADDAGSDDAATLIATVLDLADVLGFAFDAATAGDDDDEIDALVAARSEAKAAKDFATADRIRDELTERGIIVEDTATGATWRRS